MTKVSTTLEQGLHVAGRGGQTKPPFLLLFTPTDLLGAQGDLEGACDFWVPVGSKHMDIVDGVERRGGGKAAQVSLHGGKVGHLIKSTP